MTLHNPAYLRIILDRYDIPLLGMMEQGMAHTPYVIEDLKHTILGATQEHLFNLISEIIRTENDLSLRVASQEAHNERLHDLVFCLQLDNYMISDHNLICIEPEIDGLEPLEDDLTIELRHSGLGVVNDIFRMLDESAEDFRKVPPDFNGCLSNVRIALETLGKAVAMNRGATAGLSWGQVLSYLRTSGMINENEEKGFVGVYGFISQGAHRPVGLSEQEMARLGRSLALSMCYFLIKLHNE